MAAQPRNKKCGCGAYFSEQGLADHQRAMNHSTDTKPFKNKPKHTFDPENDPDWTGKCAVCSQSPVHPMTGMCGPCTFGEADTIMGNW